MTRTQRRGDPLPWSVVLDLHGDPVALTAALVDIPSESRHEKRIADEIEAALPEIWNEDLQAYCARDMKTGEFAKAISSGAALGLLAGQPSTRQVQVRRSSLQPPGFELQTYWPVREGLNAPRHGTPQVVHTCAPLTSHLDLASRQDASYNVSRLPLQGWFRTVATSPQLVANSTTLA